MSSPPVANIFELLSILIGAAILISGYYYEPKTKKGKLTKWGVAAVILIIVSNALSVFVTYSKQQSSDEEKIRQLKKDRADLAHQDSVNKKQIKLQDSVIALSNSLHVAETQLQIKSNNLLLNLAASLKIENNIQSSSTLINENVLRNIEKQNELYDTIQSLNRQSKNTLIKQNSMLNEQHGIGQNINRTLNPILPFAVTYTLTIKCPRPDSMDHNSNLFNIAYLNLLKTIRKYGGLKNPAFEKHTGLSKSMNEARTTAYDLTTGYKRLSDFKFLEDMIGYIDISFSSKNDGLLFDLVTGNRPGDLRAEAQPSFISFHDEYLKDVDFEHNSFNGIDISYEPGSNDMKINFYVTNVSVVFDDGLIKSSIDLKNALLGVSFIGLPYAATLNDFAFYFPPSYSKRIIFNTNKQHTGIGMAGDKTLALQDTLSNYDQP